MNSTKLLLCTLLVACTPLPAPTTINKTPPPPLSQPETPKVSPKEIDTKGFSWSWLRPKPQGNPLDAILVGDKYIYATGDGGTFLASNDDGKTWSTRDTGTQISLSSMSQNDEGELFVVGGNGIDGVILRTRDHGATWSTKKIGEGHSINAVWASGHEVFAVGWEGAIYHSPDAGDTWELQASNTDKTLMSVVGEGKEVYALSVHGLLLSTKDLGKTWKKSTVPGGGYFYQMWRDSTGDLFAVGDFAKLLRSTDKGKTWKPIKLAEDGDFERIWGDAQGHIYATGNSGSWRSLDHGKSWKLFSPERLGAISGRGEQLFLAGDHGELAKSNDLGDSWEMLSTNEPGEFYDITGINASSLLVVGGDFMDGAKKGLILQSKDGGASWSKAQTEHPVFRGAWATEGLSLIVGDKGTLLRSEDNGASWGEIESGTEADLLSVWGRSMNEIYAVGAQGTILRSTDKGKSWSALSGPGRYHYLSIYGSPSGALFIAGAQKTVFPVGTMVSGELYTSGTIGFLLRSVDNGQTWENVIPIGGEPDAFVDVWANGAGVHTVMGTSLYSSFDDGKTWSNQWNMLSLGFFSVSGVGSEIFAVGSKGAVFRATGSTLTRENIAANVSLRASWTAPDETLFVIGNGGTILRFGR